MAKKYLLYIHATQFEEEKKKSELVNRLLEEHYSNRPIGDLKIAKNKRETRQELGAVIKLCRHGYDPWLCRYAKGGKRCGG